MRDTTRMTVYMYISGPQLEKNKTKTKREDAAFQVGGRMTTKCRRLSHTDDEQTYDKSRLEITASSVYGLVLVQLAILILYMVLVLMSREG